MFQFDSSLINGILNFRGNCSCKSLPQQVLTLVFKFDRLFSWKFQTLITLCTRARIPRPQFLVFGDQTQRIQKKYPKKKRKERKATQTLCTKDHCRWKSIDSTFKMINLYLIYSENEIRGKLSSRNKWTTLTNGDLQTNRAG